MSTFHRVHYALRSMHAFTPHLPLTLHRQRLQPSTVLAWMMFLVPALGVPSELMLQDTLKSALVAFGILGAAIVFFWQQCDRTKPLLWHGVVWLPLALMAYALGSMVWSHTYLAGVEAIRWFLLALLLWLGLNTLTRENLPTLLWGIHGGAVVASAWAALQFWLDFSIFPQGASPSSTFVNRNFFAEYAVSALPFSIYLLANMRASRWLPCMALSVVLEVIAIMMTGTRSALVALVVLMPVFALLLLRYRSQFAFASWPKANKILVGVVLLGGFMVLGSVPQRNQSIEPAIGNTTALQRSLWRTASIVTTEEYMAGSFSVRAIMWKATARMVMANPLAGVGAGAWEVQIPLFQSGENSFETDYYAHNEYLQLLAEYGVVVGGFFLAVLLAYLLITGRNTRSLSGAQLQEAPLRAITLTSMLALLIVSNAGFPWRLAATGALLALNLALLAASDVRLGLNEAFFVRPLRWCPALSRTLLPLLACCFLLTFVIWYQAAEVERKIVSALQMGNAALRPSHEGMAPDRKAQLLKNIKEGIAINPHYRKLTPMVADQLAELGDWEDAIWIWESVAISRPHIAAIWSNLARGYAQRGESTRALDAVQRWQQLEPDAIGSLALEATLLEAIGQNSLAVQKITNAYGQGRFDFALLQTGYAIGLRTQNLSLAIRSLELRNQIWPEHAADGYFRLGKIYASDGIQNSAMALAAFRRGLALIPADRKNGYRSLVPLPYREQM